MQPIILPPDIDEQRWRDDDTLRRSGFWTLGTFVVAVIIVALAVLFLVTAGTGSTGTTTVPDTTQSEAQLGS